MTDLRSLLRDQPTITQLTILHRADVQLSRVGVRGRYYAGPLTEAQVVALTEGLTTKGSS